MTSDREDTYKLYRTVYEIIHPTISKKNISNYKIMIQEDLVPLRIFYPKKSLPLPEWFFIFTVKDGWLMVFIHIKRCVKD